MSGEKKSATKVSGKAYRRYKRILRKINYLSVFWCSDEETFKPMDRRGSILYGIS